MSRRCQCHRNCRHLVPSRHMAYPAEKLEALAPLLEPLIDASYHFDAAGLQLDPECEVHGIHPVPHGVCACPGPRSSAVEYVQWLVDNLRAGGARAIDFDEARRAGQLRRQGILEVAG